MTWRRAEPQRAPRLRLRIHKRDVRGASDEARSHTRHVGRCPDCQRAQLARWQHQLAAVTPKSNLARKES